MVSKNFIILFIMVTITFSFFAYKPADVVIAGPQMTDLEYFLDELKIIENSTIFENFNLFFFFKIFLESLTIMMDA